MIFSIPAPKIVTIIIATKMVGNPNAASDARMINMSGHPGRKPAIKPSTVPTKAPVPNAMRLMNSAVRAP